MTAPSANIHSLPLELLASILDLIRGPTSSFAINLAVDNSNLLAASLVCSRWRDLAQQLLCWDARVTLHPIKASSPHPLMFSHAVRHLWLNLDGGIDEDKDDENDLYRGERTIAVTKWMKSLLPSSGTLKTLNITWKQSEDFGTPVFFSDVFRSSSLADLTRLELEYPEKIIDGPGPKAPISFRLIDTRDGARDDASNCGAAKGRCFVKQEKAVGPIFDRLATKFPRTPSAFQSLTCNTPASRQQQRTRLPSHPPRFPPTRRRETRLRGGPNASEEARMLDAFDHDNGSPDSNHSSPNAYDNDLDSSSSDHSSPSDDSAFASGPAAAPNGGGGAWPYDMTGLSIPTLIGIPSQGPRSASGRAEWNHSESTFDGAYGGKSAFVPGDDVLLGMDEDPNVLALTGDFWSTAPSTTVHSPVERRQSHYFDEAAERDIKPDVNNSMEVEFGDMVHDNVCGPSSVASPEPSFSQAPAYATMPSSGPSNSGSEHLFLSTLSMSMPLDLLAVNAGIAPQLMGGERSPPLDSSHQIGGSSASRGSATSSDRERDGSNGSWAMESDPEAGTSESGGSRDASATRAPIGIFVAPVPSPPRSNPSNPIPSAPASTTSTNLVAKDAVVAANVISTLVSPPHASIAHATSAFKLLVLGVPTIGAKSRVETQIKISLVLVAPKDGRQVKAEDGLDQQLMTQDGGLADNAGDALERIGSWSHVRLPKYLALKKKNKKQAKLDPAPEDTLFLDVAVIRGSEPYEEIFICTGCQQRELKRAQRKKDARVHPTNEAGAEGVSPKGVEEDEERRKVVVFNCAEYVEFGTGETVLPTRITCYCRHHKERKGFSVGFTLRTAAGVIVASGATPPIMITDDHKTSIRPLVGSTSTDISVETIETIKPNKRKAAVKLEKPAPEPPQSSRPKRAAGRQKAARGSTESDDDGAAAGPSIPLPRVMAGSKKATKPYDSDSRPKKRQSGVHKSPMFAMTPLTTSKSGSPVLRPLQIQEPSPMSAAASPIVPHVFDSPIRGSQDDSWHSALGLGGMDAVMQDFSRQDSIASSGHYSNTDYSTAPSNAEYSTAPSNAPSPAQSNDWRSNASSPSSHSADPFASMFNSLNSPLDMMSPRRSGLSTPSLHNAPSSHNPQQQTPVLNDSFASLYDPTAPTFNNNWPFTAVQPPPPPPRISRLIPGEGPVHGGIEVTVLGENFVPNLVCVFGDSAAVPTHYWSSSTLVCILPPSANPGPVVVGIKGVPLTVEQGTGLQLFTYKDDSDRSLLELALQVVGLKMTGRLEDASAVAMRIVGSSAHNSSTNTPAGSRHPSPGAGNVLAGMAAYATSRPSSRAPSRRASQVNLNRPSSSPASSISGLPLPPAPFSGDSRNFEGIVIKFLSLLDLDPSEIPGAAPSLPRSRPPISYKNKQQHTLLHLATVLGFHRLVQFLLARGIAVDTPDRNGYTPLHFAALYGRVAITRQLLDAGATPYPRNLAGDTPLDIAVSRDDVDVEEAFLRSVPRQRPVNSRSASSNSRPQVVSRRAPEPEVDLRGTYSDSGDSSGDESDVSFHSSDQDDSDSSDIERRISRTPSMVSLHYLLEAEADVDAEYEAGSPSCVGPLTDDEHGMGSESDEAKTPGSSSPAELPPTTRMDELANAAGTWLSRSLKTPLPFPNHLNKLPQLQFPIATAWEKMQTNPVWEKMRPQNGFQMPELVAFPSMASMPAFAPWRMGAKTDADEHEDVHSKEPKEKGRRAPWWPRQASVVDTSPPPMYTPALPAAALASPSTSASTLDDTVYQPPRSISPPSKAQVQVKLQRRVGYAPEDISDSMVQSYVTHEKKLHRLRDDRM
ncbi:hypothetical protein P7C70_g2691, partial [Phenoliferia sp. Uapishka_3]